MRLRRKRFIIFVVLAAILASSFLVYVGFPQWWGRLFYPLRYKREIAASSSKYDLDPYLVSAIIYEESKFDPTCESSAGAVGLMQIMPYTGKFAANSLRIKDYSAESLVDAKTNINIGCWYLSHLADEYKSLPLALAAYNGGRSNTDRWLKEKDGLSEKQFIDSIPFPETRDFVRDVYQTKRDYEKVYPEEFVNQR